MIHKIYATSQTCTLLQEAAEPGTAGLVQVTPSSKKADPPRLFADVI